MKLKPIKQDRFAGGPNDLAWHIQDTVIRLLNEGSATAFDEFIFNIELQAARILKNSLGIDDKGISHRNDLEGWRRYWVNEALYMEGQSVPCTPEFYACNVFVAASNMRAAIEAGRVEMAIAIGMRIAAEAIAAGDYFDLERKGEAADKAEANGIGKGNAEYARLEKAAIAKAKSIWNESPDKRIGEVCQDILDAFITRKAAHANNMKVPNLETIKGWLKVAESIGTLVIPKKATKGGRPKKK